MMHWGSLSRKEVAGVGAREDDMGFDFQRWERESLLGGRVSWPTDSEEDKAVMIFRRQQGAARPEMGKMPKLQI
ncbi:hypothetical protein ACLOJK_009766 [Asimina triloba]